MKKRKAQVTRRVASRKKKSTAKSSTFFKQLPVKDWRVTAFLSSFMFPVLVMVFMTYWIKDPTHLKIKSVEVRGDLKYLDKASLQPIIEPFVKTNLYLLDSKSLEEEIEFNPWVYSASLTSVWPDKLLVKIQEQTPIAFWGTEGMVNEFGEVVDVNLPAKRGKLPMLYSPFDKGREMVENYLKVSAWMKDFPIDIVAFTEDTRGSWTLKLANGLNVKVGRREQERRIRRFIVGYGKQLIGQVKKNRHSRPALY